MRNRGCCVLAVLTAVAFGLAASARAQIVAAQLTALTPPLPNPFDEVYLSGAGDLYEGVGAISWQGVSTNVSPFNGPFTSFCMDLLDNVEINGNYAFQINTNIATSPQASAFPGFTSGGMGAGAATALEELYGEAYSSAANSATNEAAFQLAIWSLIYDTYTDPTTVQVNDTTQNFYTVGGADLTSAAISQANAWLAGLSTGDVETDLIALTGQPLGDAPGDAGAQDQIFSPQPFDDPPAPLPPSALSGGVLLAGLGLARIRRYLLNR